MSYVPSPVPCPALPCTSCYHLDSASLTICPFKSPLSHFSNAQLGAPLQAYNQVPLDTSSRPLPSPWTPSDNLQRHCHTVLQCPLYDKLHRELETTYTSVCAPNAQSNTEQQENALHILAGKITPQMLFRRSCWSKQTQPTYTRTTTLKP